MQKSRRTGPATSFQVTTATAHLSVESAVIPALTRRRDLEAPDECWHVYYGDVRIGTIAKRVGIPITEDPWGWACGFCPGCHPREQTHGTAPIFDQTRAAFEEAWRYSSQTAPRPISRNGARLRPSPRGNIACGIPGTGCRRSRRMADRNAFAALA
jgi:hypothetical protein